MLGENITRLGHGPFVRQPHEQFVIDVQAARVEVGRAGIGNVTRDDQLGVEDLWLVFVNFHAGPQQPLVKTVRGELYQRHVRFARQDQLHAAAAAGHLHQGAPQSQRRKKIGCDDLRASGLEQIFAQREFDGAASATGPAQQ